jgi:hypothetical protein
VRTSRAYRIGGAAKVRSVDSRNGTLDGSPDGLKLIASGWCFDDRQIFIISCKRSDAIFDLAKRLLHLSFKQISFKHVRELVKLAIDDLPAADLVEECVVLLRTRFLRRVTVGGAYAKKSFLDRMQKVNTVVVTRLRKDAAFVEIPGPIRKSHKVLNSLTRLAI